MKRTLTDIYNAINLRLSSDIYVNKKYDHICYKNQNNEVIILLTVSNEHSIGKVIHSKGKNIKEAIHLAIEIFLKQFPETFRPNQFKLDLVKNITPISKDDESEWILKRNFRDIGLCLDKNFNYSVTPEEIKSYSIIEKRKINFNQLLKALNNNLVQINETELNQMLNDGVLFEFSTKSFYIDADNFIEVSNGRRKNFNFNQNTLFRSIELTKNNYFKNVVQDNGKFIYSYLPSFEKIENRYNILRHAGTIYSMLEVYELIPDKELLKKINKAINYLISSMKVVKVNNEKTKVVVERDVNKLGGNGLAIVALAKYTSVTNDYQYQLIMEELAQWIIETQDEHGEFSIHKQEYSTGKLYDFTSRFYPGEAILALVRLYNINHNEQLIDVAEKAAKFLINHRDKNETVETITPDHWLLYGLNELHKVRSNEVYIIHAFMMSEAMINKQLTKRSTKRKMWVGGYQTRTGRAPGLTTTACWSEGLTATYNLAYRNGYEDLMKKIDRALNRSIRFQLQAQLRPESTLFYKNKQLCLGAMPKSLINDELRIDYTQHNISSFVNYFKILNSN